MDMWSVLRIEATKDVEAIKDAYRERLMKVNPEDDPEGFLQLRQAYEAALEYAKKTETSGFDDSDVGRFMQQVDAVYQNYQKRIQPEVWDELFSQDVVVALDSREAALEALLSYFMEHHLVPHRVWKVVVEQFSLIEREDELTEKFPKDFLDYIINNAKYEDSLDYSLFEETDPSLPYDTYIRLYLTCNGHLQRRETEKAEELWNSLTELGLTHPQGNVMHVRLLLQQENKELARFEAEEILQEYEHLTAVKYMMAELCWVEENYPEAQQWYQSILDTEPQHYAARCGYAECLMKQGVYAEAKKRFKELLNDNRFDNYVHRCMMECNAQLVAQYEARLAENARDYESMVELVWCHYQNYNFQEAREVLEKTPEPEDAFVMDYDYLWGRVTLQMNEREQALKYFDKWIEDYEKHKDDDADEEVMKRNHDRCGLTNFFIAEIYSDLAKENEAEATAYYEKALTYNDRALEKGTIDQGMFLTQRSELFLKLDKPEACITYGEKAIAEEPNNFEAYIQMGSAYVKMEQYHEGLDAFENAINYCPEYAKPYVEMMKIFFQFEAYERIKDLLERYDRCGFPSLWIKIYRAKLARIEGDLEEAKKQIAEIEAGLQDEEQPDDIQEKDSLYHEKALICYYDDRLDDAIASLKQALELSPKCTRYHYFMGNLLWEKEDYDAALASFEQAHKQEPNNTNIMLQMGGVYMDQHKGKSAHDMFQKIVELEPEHPQVYGKMGQNYENAGMSEEALSAYSKQLEIDPSSYYYISRGLIYFGMGRFAEAEADYNAASEADSGNGYAYYNQGRLYMAKGNLEEAILLYEKAIEVSQEQPAAIFYKYLARAYSRKGEVKKACEILRKAEEMRLAPAASVSMAGDLCATHGLSKEALQYYKKLQEMTGDSDAASHEITMVKYLQMGLSAKLSVGMEAVKRVHANPEDLQDKVTLAELYCCDGKWKKAAELLRQVQSDRASGSWRLKYATCLYYLGQKDATSLQYLKTDSEMHKVLDKAEEIFKRDYEDYMLRRFACLNLSEIAFMRDNLMSAQEYLDEAKRLPICDMCNERGCYEVLTMEGRLLERAGKKQEAKEKYQQALDICKNDYVVVSLLNRLKK